MTQTTQKSQFRNFYSCECLVNSKIPTSLFTKLETRLRRHLQSIKYNKNDFSSCQSDLLEGDEVLATTIESLKITEDLNEVNNNTNSQDYTNADYPIEDGMQSSVAFKLFLYKYPDSSKQSTTRTISLNTQDSGDINSSSEISNFYTSEIFPSPSYQGLWESLEFDSTVKDLCLAYLTAIFGFTLKGMTEQNEISFNRILLLHGPPGTGKLFIFTLYPLIQN